MHTTVTGAARSEPEAHLADRSGGCKECRDCVASARRERHRQLWIDGRRRAALGRVNMAAGTAIEVETWSETVAELLDLGELALAGHKQSGLIRREAREGITRIHTG